MSNSKNVSKKITAIFTVFVLVISLFPLQVFANNVDYNIYTLSIDGVTNSSAKVKGSAYVYSGGTMLEKGIAYSTDPNGANLIKVPYGNNNNGDMEVTISSLQPGTTYYVRAYVKFKNNNNVEDIKYGNYINSKTTGTSGNLGTLSATMLNVNYYESNKATARARINTSGHDIKKVGFVYSKDNSSPTYNNSKSVYNNWYGDPEFQNTLVDLYQNDTYYVRAFVQYDNDNFIYSDYITYSHRSGSSTNGSSNNSYPRVDTSSASYQNLNIKADGLVNSSDLSNLYERGFVYSHSESTPTLSNASKQVSSSNVGSSNFTSEWYVDSNNTTYYIRAYATNNYGTGYGQIIKVDIGAKLPIVYTKSISNVTINTADVAIDVTRSGNSSIFERGVVYSPSNSNTELYNANTKYKPTSGTIGEATVYLDGLEANTRYYVRAYARNSDGASYGKILEFFTINSDSIKTLEPTVNNTSVTAKGSINNVKENYIKEKGIVYSSTNQKPTINDMKVTNTSTSTGDFTIEISGLEKNTTYYMSTYVKTEYGYAYGNVVTFKTGGGNINLIITYKDASGAVVGTQQITTQIGAKISPSELKLPEGYNLQSYQQSYNVTESSLTINVVKVANAEKPFMEGIGGYNFAPERAVTRAEIAQIIYNLAENKAPSATSKIFIDVPASHPSKVAIDYVSSKMYMTGYPDNASFKPDATITRAEVCVVLTLVYGLSGQAFSNFTDVPNTYWGYPYISLAYNNKMIYGYPGGSFRPSNSMTRAEISTLFCNAEKRSLAPLGTQQFIDVPAAYWAYKYIMNTAIPKA